MTILISTLFFYSENISRRFLEAVYPGLRKYLTDFPEHKIFFNITNNAPEKQVTEDFSSWLHPNEKGNLSVIIQNNSWNKGFGLAHNDAFEKLPCDIFVVLNNDLIFHSENWLIDLCAEISNGAAIVGMSNAPNTLTEDGEGNIDPGEIFDYAEGSVLAIDSRVAHKNGIFAHDIRTAYYEDSDLSLRYRQLGYKIKLINIAHEHFRGTSSGVFPPATLQTIRELNKSRFLARWNRYLKTRTFTAKGLFILDCIGWGDLVCSLPAILGICAENPNLEFHMVLHLQHMRFLFEDIPNLKILGPIPENYDPDSEVIQKYDRILRFSDVRCTSVNYLAREIAATFGVDFAASLAEIHIHKIAERINIDQILSQAAGKKIAVFHFEYLRTDFEGRGIEPAAMREIFSAAAAAGFWIVNVGGEQSFLKSIGMDQFVHIDLAGQIDLKMLIALIAKADLFVGIDSGPFHLAQFLSIRTFAIFGATSPVARVLNWEKTYAYLNDEVSCLGCYHLLANSFVFNRCIRIDQACVKKIDSRNVASAFNKFISSGHTNLAQALQVSQRIEALESERNIRIGQQLRISQLERNLAEYESGMMQYVLKLKRIAKRVPGARKFYNWLKRKRG